ncbi:MAG: glutathione S-transferase family protein [Woeseiaceae bacterium]
MYQVYGDMLSGNCYKIKLLMQFLEIEHEWRHVDILGGETHTDDFVSMNSNAKIPVLKIDESEYLSESNAILNFLAEGTGFLPEAGLQRARVLQWQFFEQYSHEPYIAVARFIQKFLGMPADRAEEFHSKQAGGYRALKIMEEQLSKSPYFVGKTPTIADISLYAYTHVADEGGFDLSAFTEVQEWLSRIEALPNYVVMARENG